MMVEDGEVARFTQTLEWGYRLAETPIGDYSKGFWGAKGWKELVEGMPQERQATAAIMLENARRFYTKMPESTRTSSLGSFDKWIFPVISNMAENDIIDQLVAVQPMPGPTSQIVFMDIVTSQRKGNIPAGSPMWRALAGAADRYMDADEVIESEDAGATSGGGAASYTLDYTPVRSGSVAVVVGTGTAIDDGAGSLAGDFTGTVNYSTGAVTIAGATASTEAYVSYAFDSEGSSKTQAYEMVFSSAPVRAKAYKLRTAWTEEADQNMQALYNVKAENIMLTAITGGLQYQKHRAVIADLRARANAGSVTWSGNPPTGTTYQTHKFSIVDAFATGSNMIYGATNTMMGNWLLLGLEAKTVVETLPHFTKKGNQTEMQGVAYIGDLGNFKVFADPHYPVAEFLIGAKYDQFFRTGYVLAEYQKLYTTNTYMLDDFQHKRGFATSYAKRMVNAKCFCLGSITNAATSFGI